MFRSAGEVAVWPWLIVVVVCAESEDVCVKPENELVSFVSDASWENLLIHILLVKFLWKYEICPL